MAEQALVQSVQDVFELHGFVPIETRAVEPLDQLMRKGDIQQEVYVLRRLQAADSEGDKGLGLHSQSRVTYAVPAGARQMAPVRDLVNRHRSRRRP